MKRIRAVLPAAVTFLFIAFVTGVREYESLFRAAI